MEQQIILKTSEPEDDDDHSSVEDEEEEEEEDDDHSSDEDEEEEDDDDHSSDEDEDEEEAEKWRKHYSSRQKILLIGDGDFSFSLSLARTFGSARNLVATSLDSLEKIQQRYRNGARNVMELEERGCLVLHGVDARKMSDHYFLKTQRFDRIVYNFPHVGFLFPEDSSCQIQMNKTLVKEFLRNAKALLRKDGGEIHISHKDGDPYDKWELERKAEKIGLVVHEAVPFRRADYPGYDNKRAHGVNADDPFILGGCTTYKFKLSGYF